jgi:hypothetical protein
MEQKEVTNNVNWNANATEYIVNVHAFWTTRLNTRSPKACVTCIDTTFRPRIYWCDTLPRKCRTVACDRPKSKDLGFCNH